MYAFYLKAEIFFPTLQFQIFISFKNAWLLLTQDKQWGGKKITRQAKRQKVQFEETEPASEPNTDMAEMLE